MTCFLTVRDGIITANQNGFAIIPVAKTTVRDGIITANQNT